jgi:ferredoxin
VSPNSSDDSVQLRVDGELCQGHGRCYDLFPDLFEADEVSALSRPIRPMADATAARRAASNCPESAIIVGTIERD